MHKLLVIGLFLLLPALALGQSREADLQALQRRWTLLEGHRGRLEQLLTAQVRRIGRLKAQRPGVRRDFQLENALRENQKLAAKLTGLQRQIRELGGRLITAYDAEIKTARDPQERRRLKQLRARLVRERKSSGSSTIVTSERASPLDSAEDLEEKADLLKDSEEKVQRQLRRIQAQIKRLQHRARLKRHSRAVEDSPFVEDSPRRLARAKTSSSGGAASADDRTGAPKEAAPQDPAPAAPPSNTGGGEADSSFSGTPGYKTNDASAPGGGGSWTGGGLRTDSDLNLTIRGVMDPSTLRELQQAARSGSLKDRIAALEKARKRLEQTARRLNSQAKQLRKKAKSVK